MRLQISIAATQPLIITKTSYVLRFSHLSLPHYCPVKYYIGPFSDNLIKEESEEKNGMGVKLFTIPSPVLSKD